MTSHSTPSLSNITLQGEAVTQLYPGWDMTSRHDVAAGLSVVLFTETQSNREACWWLLSGAYQSSHALTLPAEAQQTLLTALEPLFRPLSDGVLSGSPHADATFFRRDLPIAALRELASVWLDQHAEHTVHIPSGHADNGEALTCPNGDLIPEGRVSTLLQTRLNAGALILTSPFSGAPLRAQISLDLISHTAYRFHDTDDGRVFYLIWPVNETSERPSFYYPRGRLLISDSPLAALLPDWILAWFAQNPDHSAAIAQARPFLAEDFGVGRASTVRFQTQTIQTTSPHAERPDTHRSPAQSRPDFLPVLPLPPVTPHKQTDDNFFQRLKKRLFRPKTL
ncbi:hypothetical protein [Neokomagataea thailandica]|uniref:DUF4123 domain-containing protein n=1 Tax=Neokomagataea tanensis NBRC 106556 TaxID=1223519 RepID=A0ABQ0QGW6_9PROT|nr:MULTISPECIES: hypothetical protein [Neokomagataea]GBR44351.1 hypothetical protein AA106556_0398 [Neokomagataea tanensis NBRC 106556]